MSAIELTRLTAEDATISYEFDYPKDLRRFFSGENFVVEYDVSVDHVPEGLLVVPWLANVCPIAWATGTDVVVPTLDGRFREALPDVGEAFRELYPEFITGNVIRVRDATDDADATSGDADATSGDGNAAMLFSGGVDSVATYYRRRDETPALIGVHGLDVRLHRPDAWAEKRRRTEAFAAARGLETFYVEANLVPIQNLLVLYAQYEEHLHTNWLDAVHVGIGLPGLCAPLAYAEGFDRLYMADSITERHVEEGTEAVGNHPNVVSSIAWTGTSVENDGVSMTRQEKVDLIAETVREEDEDLELHVCLESDVGNCNRCEKCIRTALALVLAGLDPDRYGFEVDGEAIRNARTMLESGEWELGDGLVPHWKDVQHYARRRDRTFERPETAAFFEWLVSADLDELGTRETDWTSSLLYATIRRTPYPVYELARRFDSLHALASRISQS